MELSPNSGDRQFTGSACRAMRSARAVRAKGHLDAGFRASLNLREAGRVRSLLHAEVYLERSCGVVKSLPAL